MKVLLVHLSDIHLKCDNNPVFERQEQICKAIQNIALDSDKVFIIITGDIADSGRQEEYTKAIDLLEYIKDRIETYSKKEVRFVMVPGNHDCYFEIKNIAVRDKLVKDIQQNLDPHIDSSIIEQCCEVQRGYEDFLELYQDKGNVIHSDKLCCILKYDLDGYTIVFYCYNTSWASELKEHPSKLHFPIKQFPKEYLGLRANLSISVLHHPFIWHNPQSARDFSNHLETTSQIILTGHVHISSKSLKDNLEGNLTEYIEGSSLQDEEDEQKSGFNVIQIDFDSEVQRICQYEWNGELYSITSDTGYITYQRFISPTKGLFEINKVFEEQFLEDLGAQLRHPKKPKMSLNDIFIFPDLKDIRAEKQHEKYISYDRKRADIILQLKGKMNRFLLIGAEHSGKTALCKMLFKNYYNKGYVPIYLSGDDIKSTSIDKFNKLVEHQFSEQYVYDNIEKFRQLENDKKFIIVDDYDNLKVNLKYRSVLLHRINAYYPNTVITGNDLFHIGEIVAEEEQEMSPLKDYGQYVIMQFGNTLRTELIEKWNILGREEYIEEAEIIRRNDETKKVVDTIIGRNLVPSYPLYLLTMLQGMEIGFPHELEESSYGHYYQILIGESIRKVVESNDKIDAYYNFLQELAYYLFKSKAREITLESLSEFHQWYCKEYKVSNIFTELVNLSVLIKNLADARIITEINKRFRFKYKYIYFFFVAKYLSDNIDKDNSIKEIISEMTKRLYVEDFANTILFLTHHSKNPFIMDVILTNAKHIFQECQPVKFEHDVIVVNELLEEIPKLVLEDRDVRKHRKKIDMLKDKIEMGDEDAEEVDRDLDVKQNIAKLDMLSKLNLTFKTLEILGQILKNYHSSLKGDLRFSIAEETYLLGLRSLEPFFEILRTHNNYIIKRIESFIEKKKLVDEIRVEEAARKIVFGLCMLVSTGFIKKISDSVGTEYLSETYKELLDKYDTNAVNLVDMSIKLDFFRTFPLEELRVLKKKVENNLLPLIILKEMVIDYLYMFPTDVKDKQRICSILEIPMQELRLIDMTSTQKKR